MQEMIYNLYGFSNERRPFNVLMAGISYCDGTYRVERKPENLYSFEYIYGGKGTLSIGGQVLTPQKGDVYLLKKGVPHCYWSDENDPWTKIWICFNGKFAESLFSSYLDEDVYLIRGCDISGLMEEMLRKITEVKENYDLLTDEIAQLTLQTVLTLKRGNSVRRRTLPEEVKEWLDLHVEENVRLEQVCDHFHYSRNHLINQFKNRYQVTPYQYLKEQKLEAAKRYLQDSSLSIHEIAVRLSYTDENYFHSCFKEAMGITPGAYRKQVLEERRA